MLKILFQIVLFIFLFIHSSYSQNFKKILINGNERISNETILVFSDLPQDKFLNENSINLILKKLYKSGFFSDVVVKIENDNLIIDVLENPIIQTVFIEGIKRKKTEESLFEILSFKSIFVVIIFPGFSTATFSISTPPSTLLIKAIFELSLSTKHDK